MTHQVPVLFEIGILNCKYFVCMLLQKALLPAWFLQSQLFNPQKRCVRRWLCKLVLFGMKSTVKDKSYLTPNLVAVELPVVLVITFQLL